MVKNFFERFFASQNGILFELFLIVSSGAIARRQPRFFHNLDCGKPLKNKRLRAVDRAVRRALFALLVLRLPLRACRSRVVLNSRALAVILRRFSAEKWRKLAQNGRKTHENVPKTTYKSARNEKNALALFLSVARLCAKRKKIISFFSLALSQIPCASRASARTCGASFRTK